MADDTSNVVLDPVWYQAAVIPNTYRFDAVEHGNAALYFVEAPDANAALVLYETSVAGADPSPTITAYTPTNLQLQTDWANGGFIMLSVS